MEGSADYSCKFFADLVLLLLQLFDYWLKVIHCLANNLIPGLLSLLDLLHSIFKFSGEGYVEDLWTVVGQDFNYSGTERSRGNSLLFHVPASVECFNDLGSSGFGSNLRILHRFEKAAWIESGWR